MPSSTIVVLIAAAYLVACLVVGMWPGRGVSATSEGYVAGDRSLGLVLMFFITGATIFSAFAFLGGPGWAYSRGAAAMYILGYGALGFAPWYFLGPRAARLGRRFGFVTQAEMVAQRFGLPAIAGVMALVSVVAFVPYLALQMKGAGYVLSTVTHGAIPVWAGAAIVYGIVMVYVLYSGVLGVGWTNTFQGIFMLILAWCLGLYLPWKLYGGVGPMFEQIMAVQPQHLVPPGLRSDGAPWSWGEYSAAIVVSAVGFSFWPHLFMKAFSARDERTIRRTVVLYPIFQVFLIPLFFIGFAGVLFADAPPSADQILPHMLMHMEIPAVVVGLFCAGALAASMSSGDAMAHAAASIAVRDGLVGALGTQLKPTAERTMIRVLVVVVMALSYVTAILYTGSLVTLLLSAYGAVVQFATAVVAALYWRWATGPGVLSGLLVGSLVTVVLVVEPAWQPIPLHAGLYGLIANLVSLVLVSRLFGGDSSEDAATFLAVADGDTAG